MFPVFNVSPRLDSRHAGLLSVCILFFLVSINPIPALQGTGGGIETGTGGGADLSRFQDEKNLPVGNPGGTGVQTQGSVNTDSLGRLFLALLLVGGVLWAVSVILKPGVKTPVTDQEPFENLGSMKLSTSVSVHVLRLGKKAWVLASSPSSTTVLDTLEDEELIEELAEKARSSRNKGLLPGQRITGSLVSILSHITHRIPGVRHEPSTSSSGRHDRTNSGEEFPADPENMQESRIMRSGMTRDNEVTEIRSLENVLREQRKRLGSLSKGDKS